MSTNASPFEFVYQAPADPILGLTEAFNADPCPSKVNLGVGVYQDGDGKVPLLEVVREAEERLLKTENSKSYLPIDGILAYNKEVQGLLFGPHAPVIRDGRVVTVQAPGGTGALSVGADFLKRFFPHSEIYISSPTWENHRGVFEAAGFGVETYPYYDPETHGLDFPAMIRALKCIPPGNIILLHACCHNPTGVDPSRAQWEVLVDHFRSAGLIPFLDFAYQGLGDGLEEDAFAVRAFADAGIPCLVANSFSKSFSLYRERVGALTILTTSAEESKRVLSQVKRVIRANYSNPPSHGAQIVATVLGDSELRARWEVELAEMRQRIRGMRYLFVKTMKEKGVLHNFSFMQQQKGMFSFTGIPTDVVHRLRGQYSLYIVDSGRICIAAVNDKNLDYIGSSIAKVMP